MIPYTADSLPELVRRRVAAALGDMRGGDRRPIEVDMKNGRAVLCGTVRHWSDRNAAGRAAAGVPGVTGVDNQIALLVKGKIARR